MSAKPNAGCVLALGHYRMRRYFKLPLSVNVIAALIVGIGYVNGQVVEEKQPVSTPTNSLPMEQENWFLKDSTQILKKKRHKRASNTMSQAKITGTMELIEVTPITIQGERWLIIDALKGWKDVKRIKGKVLEYFGRDYTFKGWSHPTLRKRLTDFIQGKRTSAKCYFIESQHEHE